MRKLRTLVVLSALVLSACCDDDEEHHGIVIQTLSDQYADGDIEFSPLPEPDGTYTISQADVTESVLFGIDSEDSEFRAFLDFPLDGATGGGVVPLDAEIVWADIEVFVNDVPLNSTVPTLLDLVSFPLNGLTSTDFDSAPLKTRGPFDFYRSDIDNYVRIDVTPLMEETQARELPDLQVRFRLNSFSSPEGVVELDDSEAETAPLLTVKYR